MPFERAGLPLVELIGLRTLRDAAVLVPLVQVFVAAIVLDHRRPALDRLAALGGSLVMAG
jgi:hypothetical protein